MADTQQAPQPAGLQPIPALGGSILEAQEALLSLEVPEEEKPKEDSDLCHIISVEGAFNELLVTVINWYQRGNITNTELYYEISGKTPLEVVYAFCEKYNIEAKSEVKMIEDMSSDNFDSIESNIQRSLIF